MRWIRFSGIAFPITLSRTVLTVALFSYNRCEFVKTLAPFGVTSATQRSGPIDMLPV